MKNRVPASFGSMAKRKGLRSPQAKVSWHLLPGVVCPVTLQRAVPAPWKGLLAGMPPVSRDAQELAGQHVLVPGGVVRPGTAAVVGIVAAAVADR